MVVSATTLSVSASLQIALCGAMALGWSPFPKMGIREAAIACILSFGLAALYFAFRMQTGGSGLHLQWRSLKFKASLFKDILGVGLISSVNATQTIATAVIITGLVGSFGTAAIAGYGLGVRLELLQITIIFAIGSVLIPMVGINIGRGNVKRARKIARLGAALAAGITGYVGVTVALWPSLWAGLFSSDPGVLNADTLIYISPDRVISSLAQVWPFTSHHRELARLLCPCSQVQPILSLLLSAVFSV